MGQTYEEFIERKSQLGGQHGFKPVFMPDFLFDFQRSLVEWAVTKGRAAVFADCLGGEAIVHSPDGDVRIAAAFADQRPIRVYALDGEVVRVAQATPPFIAGAAALYEYHFASGRRIIASGGHRFLTRAGWRRGDACRPGERLAVSDAAQLRTIAELGPSVPRGDALHSSRTVPSCEENCWRDSRRDGERPRELSGSGRVSLPSPSDARERIPPRSHGDASADGSGYSHPHPSVALRATGRYDLQAATIAGVEQYQPRAFDRSRTDGNTRNVRQVREETNRERRVVSVRPSEEQLYAGDLCVASADSVVWFDTLVAVKYIRTDVFYDIEVPGPACFLADGVWSHNCGLGKTPMALTWAENVVRHTNGRVLVLTPLAVGPQFVTEGEKFGIEVHRNAKPEGAGIYVANYERLHHYDPAEFVGIVCDESSILKHFTGVTQKAVTRFSAKLPYRLLCTATAAPNDYVELGTSSEALGELGHSDMLTRFFKQTDNKSRFNDIKASREDRALAEAGLTDTRGGNHFAKLAFRVSQTFGQWRLKGHAEIPFWRWVASWARACRKPSDLGFDDGPMILPALNEREHEVEPTRPADGMLFTVTAFGLREEREERRRTLTERCELVAKLVDHREPAIVWCHMNDEGDRLENSIPGVVQVSGSDSDDEKEEKFAAFQSGAARVLITKPKIGAWGLNFQHCAHVVTFASHSFEQYYQSVRRCWRFGQKRPVTVDIISTTGEGHVRESMRRKAASADAMYDRIVGFMREAQRITRTRNDETSIEVPSWA